MPLAYINFVSGGGATDPGFGGGMPAGPGIDNSLPGCQPGVDNSLPTPPPGIWPPPSFGTPIVPTPPGVAGTIWPPGAVRRTPPGRRAARPPGGPVPAASVRAASANPTADRWDASQPTEPIATPPPSTKPPPGTFWVVAGIPGLGWRYVCVDPSLDAGMPLPPRHAEVTIVPFVVDRARTALGKVVSTRPLRPVPPGRALGCRIPPPADVAPGAWLRRAHRAPCIGTFDEDGQYGNHTDGSSRMSAILLAENSDGLLVVRSMGRAAGASSVLRFRGGEGDRGERRGSPSTSSKRYRMSAPAFRHATGVRSFCWPPSSSRSWSPSWAVQRPATGCSSSARPEPGACSSFLGQATRDVGRGAGRHPGAAAGRTHTTGPAGLNSCFHRAGKLESSRETWKFLWKP